MKMAEWIYLGEIEDNIEVSGTAQPETKSGEEIGGETGGNINIPQLPESEGPGYEYSRIEQMIAEEEQEGHMTIWFKGVADVPPQEVSVEVDQSELKETIGSESEEIQEKLDEIKETIEEVAGGTTVVEKGKIPWWAWVIAVLGGALGAYGLIKSKEKQEAEQTGV